MVLQLGVSFLEGGAMADFFLAPQDFEFLSDIVATFISYGIGLGAIFWIVGAVVSLFWQLLRY